MPDFSTAFESFFKADNFKQSGPKQFTIAACKQEALGQEREKRVVLYVKEDERGFPLNKTNYNILSELFGSPDTDKWIGCSVEAYFEPAVVFKGKPIGGIRFRAVSK